MGEVQDHRTIPSATVCMGQGMRCLAMWTRLASVLDTESGCCVDTPA